jgi:hypothetical protein
MSDKLQFVEVVRINSLTAKLERIDHSPDKLKFTGRQPVSDCLNLSPLVEEDFMASPRQTKVYRTSVLNFSGAHQ